MVLSAGQLCLRPGTGKVDQGHILYYSHASVENVMGWSSPRVGGCRQPKRQCHRICRQRNCGRQLQNGRRKLICLLPMRTEMPSDRLVQLVLGDRRGR